MKHRLTPAQRRMIQWIKTATGPSSHPIKHESCTDPRDTCNVLVREGYVEYGPRDQWGNRQIKLTAAGAGVN